MPDLNGFVAGIARVLKPDGVAVIETPYLRELVERLEFDTIYHEHVFYHSLTALARVFERNGLVVVDVERIPVHGGSLRVFAMRRRRPASPARPFAALLAEEAAVGLCSAAYYATFAGRVDALGASFEPLLADLRSRGHTVAAYGAAAKGAVLLNAFEIGPDLISFVADRSPHKQGHLMPGVHIPIVAPDQLVEPQAGRVPAARLELRRRDPRPAGRVPAARRQVHHPGSEADGGVTMIDGVLVVPLKRIPDERGTVMHMLKRTDPHFIEFGEIYFSKIYPGVVKGWHKHAEMTLNYACIHGRIKLVLFDDRDGSPTKGELMEIFLGPDNHSLVQIPPGVWNGFKGLGSEMAIVANCSTQPHDPSRSIRLDPFDNDIPYDWEVRQH